ncbi:MAG: response regulator transcription factor [Bacteroidetes bacterium]|nr:response regulator transcription factor [Bacteroidota bacterium]
MKAILVDDENGSRESLALILEKYCPQVHILAKADSMTSALTAIQKYEPELVFLDIEMPNGSGFDLLEKIKDIDFDVVFITAYDHYAIRAIKFSAVDYLLKPIDPEDLKHAVKRVEEKRLSKKSLGDKYKTLLSNVKSESKLKKVAIPDGDGLVFINLTDIIRCDSDGNYTYFILNNGKKIMSSRTLGEYEEMFEGENFFRVHRSHLVNLDHVKKYIKGEGGYVVLSDNSQVEVSRRKKIEFLEKLGGH